MAAYWEIAAHSAYDMFSQYKYLIVNLVFPSSVFWSGNFFLIAPFSDHCLLVPFLSASSRPCYSIHSMTRVHACLCPSPRLINKYRMLIPYSFARVYNSFLKMTLNNQNLNGVTYYHLVDFNV